jgi:5-methylcytosine-specific restriction endonuclease McrA
MERRNPVDTEPISVAARLFVWQRDGGKCRNCGSTHDLHFDHVIPRSWGGASTVDNVQVLCRHCNVGKGASLIDGGGSR